MFDWGSKAGSDDPRAVWLLASHSITLNVLLSLKKGKLPRLAGLSPPTPALQNERKRPAARRPARGGGRRHCSDRQDVQTWGSPDPSRTPRGFYLVRQAVLHLALQVEGLALRGQVREDVLQKSVGRGGWGEACAG